MSKALSTCLSIWAVPQPPQVTGCDGEKQPIGLLLLSGQKQHVSQSLEAALSPRQAHGSNTPGASSLHSIRPHGISRPAGLWVQSRAGIGGALCSHSPGTGG